MKSACADQLKIHLDLPSYCSRKRSTKQTFHQKKSRNRSPKKPFTKKHSPRVYKTSLSPKKIKKTVYSPKNILQENGLQNKHSPKNIRQENGLQNKPFTKKTFSKKTVYKTSLSPKKNPRKRSVKQAFHQKTFSILSPFLVALCSWFMLIPAGTPPRT